MSCKRHKYQLYQWRLSHNYFLSFQFRFLFCSVLFSLHLSLWIHLHLLCLQILISFEWRFAMMCMHCTDAHWRAHKRRGDTTVVQKKKFNTFIIWPVRMRNALFLWCLCSDKKQRMMHSNEDIIWGCKNDAELDNFRNCMPLWRNQAI